MPTTIDLSPVTDAHYAAMTQALILSAQSPDSSTQNGAVIVSDGIIVASDCNRFPDGVRYSDERWERPLKYSFIEHAERNAIYAAARNGIALQGAVMVCVWAACPDCARAIVQAGLRTLMRMPAGEHWRGPVEIGDEIMSEAGVQVIELDPTRLGHTPWLRRNSAPWHAQGEHPTQVLSLPGQPCGPPPR